MIERKNTNTIIKRKENFLFLLFRTDLYFCNSLFHALIYTIYIFENKQYFKESHPFVWFGCIRSDITGNSLLLLCQRQSIKFNIFIIYTTGYVFIYELCVFYIFYTKYSMHKSEYYFLSINTRRIFLTYS